MKSLTGFLLALAVEGMAAVLIAGLFLSASSDQTREPADDAVTAQADAAEPKPIVVAWLKNVLAPRQSDDSLDAGVVEESASESNVAERLDHASADLGASLERELDRILEPFIDPERPDAARSD